MLPHQMQVDILDALGDDLGIKRTKRQTEIPIPEKLKDYPGYRLSLEYHQRVTQAKANRKK